MAKSSLRPLESYSEAGNPGKRDENTLDRFRGALLLAAVGDALGWPTEYAKTRRRFESLYGTKWLESYVQWTKFVGGIDGYREPIHPGDYSDDTQHTIAAARCIRAGRRFLVDRFAALELPMWLSYERGGGRTIKAAARALLHYGIKELPCVFFSKSTQGSGVDYRDAGANGAAMRILPIALMWWPRFDSSSLVRDAILASIPTHGHPRAITGAITQAVAACYLLSNGEARIESLIEVVKNALKTAAGLFTTDPILSEWARTWNQRQLGGRPFLTHYEAVVREMVGYLTSIREYRGDQLKEFYESVGAFDAAFRGSGTATVACGLFAFSKMFEDPERAILSAVNELGSDTDTIAGFGLRFITSSIITAMSCQTATMIEDRLQAACQI